MCLAITVGTLQVEGATVFGSNPVHVHARMGTSNDFLFAIQRAVEAPKHEERKAECDEYDTQGTLLSHVLLTRSILSAKQVSLPRPPIKIS